jgi:Flp pilus assembly protein TadG
MAAPLVGIAVAAAAKLAAKKLAQEAAKKAAVKAAAKASAKKIGKATGSVNVSSKGKVTEYMSGAKVTGKARNIRDNAQRAELEAQGVSKRKSVLKYPSNKLIKDIKKQTASTAKVPVKPRASRTRSGNKAK